MTGLAPPAHDAPAEPRPYVRRPLLSHSVQPHGLLSRHSKPLVPQRRPQRQAPALPQQPCLDPLAANSAHAHTAVWAKLGQGAGRDQRLAARDGNGELQGKSMQ